MRKMMILVLAVLVSGLSVMPAVAVDTTLHDGFKTGSTPDAAKWDSVGGAAVASDNLTLTGLSTVDSKMTFSPYVFALTKMMLTGDYQKFGFDPNGASTGVGIYFDTYQPGDPGYAVDKVQAIVTGQAPQTIDATWNEYHVFKIVWTASAIKFYVDGQLGATFPVAVAGPKEVGFRNDRDDTLSADWVFVTPKKVNLTYADFVNSGGILYDLDSFDTVPSATGWFGYGVLSDTVVTDFTQQNGVFVGSSVHTSSIANQLAPVFKLNEGQAITYIYEFTYSFAPKNPKFGADVVAGWGVIPTLELGESTLDAIALSSIKPKYNKKGGGLLNVHVTWEYLRGEDGLDIFANVIVRTPNFPKD